MAYAIVGHCDGATNSGAATTATTGTYSVSAGNALVCFILYTTVGGANPVVSITDNSGGNNTWTRIGTGVYANPLGAEAYYIPNSVTSASTTFTVTLTSNSFAPGLAIYEVSGLDTSAPLVGQAFQAQTAPGTGTDAVSSGNTGTLSAQPAALLGFVGLSSGGVGMTEGTGFSTAIAVMNYSSVEGFLEDKRVTSTSPVPVTFTAANGAINFVTVGVAMKESGGGGTVLLGQACL